MDCRVGAISDTEKNVHCLMPKSIWVATPANASGDGAGSGCDAALLSSNPWCLRSILVAALSVLASPGLAQDRVQVVTTTTDLRSLTEAVGGDRVEAVSLVPPNMDAEEYQPKPQDVCASSMRALLVRVGLDYDLWVDRLLAQAGRPEIARGGPGYVDASFAIAVLELRGMSVGPGDGHAHGSGNPHYWLDPKNAEIITANILEALARIDPANAAAYEANRRAFLDAPAGKADGMGNKAGCTQDRADRRLSQQLALFCAPLSAGFCRLYRDQARACRRAPRILPGSSATMRARGVRIVVREPHEPERDVAFVASKAGARW